MYNLLKTMFNEITWQIVFLVVLTIVKHGSPPVYNL
jgi:hypothetical protein